MIIEFENVFETELVAALHKALHFAKANNVDLVERLEELIDDAEHAQQDVVQ